MKVVRMLVVFLRGVNFTFWPHLGCSGQNAIIFSREGLVQGCTRKNIKIYIYCLCFNMVSFRGQKSLGHAQIGLLQGFNSKLPTRIRTPFVCSAPPPPRAPILLHVLRRMQYFRMTDQVRTRFYVSVVFTCEKVHVRIFSSYLFPANQTYHVLCNCKSSPSCPTN